LGGEPLESQCSKDEVVLDLSQEAVDALQLHVDDIHVLDDPAAAAATRNSDCKVTAFDLDNVLLSHGKA
jgi:hypothetical protein